MTVLLVATAGGHLEELHLMASRFCDDDSDRCWVTSRTAQSRALLAGQRVVWTPPVRSGDYWGAATALPRALRLLRRVQPRLVVSTGAAGAAPYLVAAALLRCPVSYVESATRQRGPSATGRLAERLPGASLFVQGAGWGDSRWRPVPDVFSAFSVEELPRAPRMPGNAVVTLGSERFPFARAVDAAATALGGADVLWQTGETRVVRDGMELNRWVPGDELRRACREADVVVTHAGVGSILVALTEGKVPVVLPRRAHRGEHIDDHQLELRHLLEDRGLAVFADPDELTTEHVQAAAGRRVRMTAGVPYAGSSSDRLASEINGLAGAGHEPALLQGSHHARA